MTETLLSIDPGEATGWSIWLVDEDRPIQRIEYGVTPNGVEGFLDYWESRLRTLRPDIIVFEEFILDGRTKFPPLVARDIQGALVANLRLAGLPGLDLQRNSDKALCPDAVLAEHGLWLLPSEVDWEDARDINDSQIHAIVWAAFKNDHGPTQAAFFPDL